MKRTRIVLLGAEMDGLDVHSNYERTSELRADLLKLGLPFVGVTNVTKTKSSQLFLVTEFEDESRMVELAKKYGQKAILVSDEERNTDVVATRSKDRTQLGRLVAVNKEEAVKKKFHLRFVEDGKEYFYATKQGEVCE